MPGQHETFSDKVWNHFQSRYPGHRWLAEDPLYGLTEDVIDAIQQQVPEFFTQEQEQFERDLARRTGGGFFLRQPLGRPTSLQYDPGLTIEEFLQRASFHPAKVHEATKRATKRLVPEINPEWSKDEATKQCLQSTREMITDLWTACGHESEDIQAAQQQASFEERLIVRRAEAYAGWLILNRQFREELGDLQATWGPVIVKQGGLPPKSVRRLTRQRTLPVVVSRQATSPSEPRA